MSDFFLSFSLNRSVTKLVVVVVVVDDVFCYFVAGAVVVDSNWKDSTGVTLIMLKDECLKI